MISSRWLFVCMSLLLCLSARAVGNDPETRLYLGPAASSGLSDLLDKVEKNNPQISLKRISPIGLKVGGFHDFGGGLAVGANLGPLVVARGDASFTIVPLGLDVRYRFAYNGNFRPYLRAGVEKAFVSGDFLEQGSAGGVIGLGMIFGNDGGRGWGVDLAYHGTEVLVAANGLRRELQSKPFKTTLTVLYAF